MAKTFGFLAVLMMAVAANADKHRLCACVRDQPPAGMIIDDEATKAVVNGSDGRFVYSEAWWYIGLHNAPHDGSYYHAIEGTVNGATDDGWVGGDESSGLCKQYNAGSTCFSPVDVFVWQHCGASKVCWTSKAARTDMYGVPLPS
ncbi:hypothetical protein CGMCC3_g2644 [Colletotrichum fructicola]|uniref:M6 protein n=1 Tax=Colletotrichum fructicola (strain Nara gc5) TaxID=1213859 RepID=A0A7J6IIG3_COLFN|nr:uncharacterized protein CGMCC3_g2644 [Colletotrichum fructicola]KAE9581559.1 hypothetical protein CGMCC3_g2644 [Colletotrichum fructicola]KAF4433240.1 hypothetical protein CFRS1_v010464 [Colletotrichum fructicola]KAF4475923.1 hypothetical protein CGGC5_v014587 [Colletotrichum fructicola Nara gc5]KAF5483255.1 hypothetical protein CGCF413_v014604 [Colletotrichum fructicola]